MTLEEIAQADTVRNDEVSRQHNNTLDCDYDRLTVNFRKKHKKDIVRSSGCRNEWKDVINIEERKSESFEKKCFLYLGRGSTRDFSIVTGTQLFYFKLNFYCSFWSNF